MHKISSPPMPIANAADYVDVSACIIEKQTALIPLIENAADYVDALTRPRTQDSKVNRKVIAGRRMRDKYLDEVVISEVVKKIA
jgi:hypothetical protein